MWLLHMWRGAGNLRVRADGINGWMRQSERIQVSLHSCIHVVFPQRCSTDICTRSPKFLRAKICKSSHPPTPSEHDAPRNTGACPSDASSCQLLFFRQRDLASLLRGASGRDREGIVACDRLRAWKHRCHAQPRCDPISTTICASSHGSQPKQETLLASPSSSYSRPRIKQTKKGEKERLKTHQIFHNLMMQQHH